MVEGFGVCGKSKMTIQVEELDGDRVQQPAHFDNNLKANLGFVIKGIILSSKPSLVRNEKGELTQSKDLSHFMAISLAKVDGAFMPLYNDGKENEGACRDAIECNDVKVSLMIFPTKFPKFFRVK